MLEQYGVNKSDLRNLSVVLLVMILVFLFLLDGPLLARLIVAVVMGTFTAVVFLVTTVLLDRYKPEL